MSEPKAYFLSHVCYRCPVGVSLSGGADELSFEASVQVDANSGEVSLVVITLDAAVTHCFEGEGPTVPTGVMHVSYVSCVHESWPFSIRCCDLSANQ